MKTLVIAPHPDDELLGPGGLLLRRKSEGATLGWVIMTKVTKDSGWSMQEIQTRENEIKQVQKGLGIKHEHLFQLGFETTRLDKVYMGDLISKVSKVFQIFQPEEVLVPHKSDIHSDHRISFDAVIACSKWFRYPFLKRVLAYETISETEFGLDPAHRFNPNFFQNISPFIDKKIELIRIYASELDNFPFPRSEKAIKALAQFRGASSGFEYAEAFELLLERKE